MHQTMHQTAHQTMRRSYAAPGGLFRSLLVFGVLGVLGVFGCAAGLASSQARGATRVAGSKPAASGSALPFYDLLTPMFVDVDGAPNAYGPPGRPTLDFERNAHTGGTLSGPIVGYLTRSDRHTPVVQGPRDPCPGYYVSTTDMRDESIDDDANPRKYLDARKINYVVLGRFGKHHHVKIGDLVVVHSNRTGRTAYAVVGDSGNPKGDEGSLALLQALGYPFHSGKDDAVEEREIVIRYYPGTNPDHRFFHNQGEIDRAAEVLKLDRSF